MQAAVNVHVLLAHHIVREVHRYLLDDAESIVLLYFKIERASLLVKHTKVNAGAALFRFGKYIVLLYFKIER